jgi:hypothetical protein
MAGRPAKKAPQAPQPSKPAFDEFADDTDGMEEDVPNLDAKGNQIPNTRSRDWRDVERYREARELKKLIGEDGFDDFDRPGRKR